MADEQKLTNNAVWELVCANTAEKIATLTKVAFVQPHNSIDYAIHLLAQRQIVACPVLNNSDAKEPLGFLQSSDIIAYVVQSLGGPDNITPKQLDEYPWNDVTIKDVLAKVRSEPVSVHYDSSQVSHFVELFATGGVHRTCLYSQKHGSEILTGVISQSDVVAFLAAHLSDDRIDFMAKQPITRLGFTHRKVQSINASATVLQAAQQLKAADVSSLVVVDDKDVVVGSFTHRAFRGLDHKGYADLTMPVAEYLKKYCPGLLKTETIQEDETFGDLINFFAKKHVHHQYILNDDGTANGIVTLSDVMRWILDFKLTDEERASMQRTISVEHAVVDTPVTLTVKVGKVSGLPHNFTSNDPFLVFKFPGGRVLKTKPIRAVKDANTGVISVDFSDDDAATQVFVVNAHNLLSKFILEVWDWHRITSDELLGRHVVAMRFVLDGFGTGSKGTKSIVMDPKLHGGSCDAELHLEMYLSPAAAPSETKE